MIITNDFIFIHFPKSGGSFVRSIVSHLYETVLENEYKEKNILQRCFATKPVFLEDWDSQILGDFLPEYKMHNGVVDIKKQYLNKPKFSVLRNAIYFYDSFFRSKIWANERALNEDKIKEKFPAFPEINFEEFMQFIHWFYVDNLWKVLDIEKNNNFGLYTIMLVVQYTKDPVEKLKIMQSQDFIEDTFASWIEENEVVFLDFKNLRTALKLYLSQYYDMDKLSFIDEKPRLNVSESKKVNISNKILKKIQEIDYLGIGFYNSI